MIKAIPPWKEVQIMPHIKNYLEAKSGETDMQAFVRRDLNALDGETVTINVIVGRTKRNTWHLTVSKAKLGHGKLSVLPEDLEGIRLLLPGVDLMRKAHVDNPLVAQFRERTDPAYAFVSEFGA